MSIEEQASALGHLSLNEAQNETLDLVAAQGVGQGRTWSYTLKEWRQPEQRMDSWQRRHHDNGSLGYRFYRGCHKRQLEVHWQQ